MNELQGIIIGKDLTEKYKGRIGGGRTILTFALRNSGKPRRTSLRIYAFPVKIRSGYLTNVRKVMNITAQFRVAGMST